MPARTACARPAARRVPPPERVGQPPRSALAACENRTFPGIFRFPCHTRVHRRVQCTRGRGRARGGRCGCPRSGPHPIRPTRTRGEPHDRRERIDRRRARWGREGPGQAAGKRAGPGVQPGAAHAGHRARRRGRHAGGAGEGVHAPVRVPPRERVFHLGVPHRAQPPGHLPQGPVRPASRELRRVRRGHRLGTRARRARPGRRRGPQPAGTRAKGIVHARHAAVPGRGGAQRVRAGHHVQDGQPGRGRRARHHARGVPPAALSRAGAHGRVPHGLLRRGRRALPLRAARGLRYRHAPHRSRPPRLPGARGAGRGCREGRAAGAQPAGAAQGPVGQGAHRRHGAARRRHSGAFASLPRYRCPSDAAAFARSLVASDVFAQAVSE